MNTLPSLILEITFPAEYLLTRRDIFLKIKWIHYVQNIYAKRHSIYNENKKKLLLFIDTNQETSLTKKPTEKLTDFSFRKKSWYFRNFSLSFLATNYLRLMVSNKEAEVNEYFLAFDHTALIGATCLTHCVCMIYRTYRKHTSAYHSDCIVCIVRNHKKDRLQLRHTPPLEKLQG